MTEPFDWSALEAEVAAIEAAEASPSITPTSTTPMIAGLPSFGQITVASFNYFDNGPNHKGKWSSSRRAMNVQFFTNTEPFTPAPGLAAWTGAVQLHEPDFWMSYVEHKHEDGKIDAVLYANLKAVYADTWKRSNSLVGTFVDKTRGTSYSWPYYIRLWEDQFGETNMETMLDEPMHIDIWSVVKAVPGKALPIMRATYNPHGLWKMKSAKGRR